MREMAARPIRIQGADSLWRSSLPDPEHHTAPEASCTGFGAHGLEWGVNHRILGRTTHLPATSGVANIDWAGWWFRSSESSVHGPERGR
jgi:rhamnogalacturonyl hydrolase YesR